MAPAMPAGLSNDDDRDDEESVTVAEAAWAATRRRFAPWFTPASSMAGASARAAKPSGATTRCCARSGFRATPASSESATGSVRRTSPRMMRLRQRPKSGTADRVPLIRRPSATCGPYLAGRARVGASTGAVNLVHDGAGWKIDRHTGQAHY